MRNEKVVGSEVWTVMIQNFKTPCANERTQCVGLNMLGGLGLTLWQSIYSTFNSILFIKESGFEFQFDQ